MAASLHGFVCREHPAVSSRARSLLTGFAWNALSQVTRHVGLSIGFEDAATSMCLGDEFAVNAAVGNPTPMAAASSNAPVRRRPVHRSMAPSARRMPIPIKARATTGKCHRGKTLNCHHEGEATDVQKEQANTHEG
jgi:hypothetical protein